jgi:hypothetical protein
VVRMGLHSGLEVETTLDPRVEPFLHDHQIEGTPVLPGVMGVEAFAELARLLWPDRPVVAVEDVRFLAPVKFHRNEPRTFNLQAFFDRDGDDLVADCQLIGRRKLAGRADEQITRHFTARVRLGRPGAPAQDGSTTPAPPSLQGLNRVGCEAIYRVYFHGPAYRVLAEAAGNAERVSGRMAADLPPDLASDATLPMAPRLIELCFQTAGVWEIGRTGRMGLPARVDRVKVLRAPTQGSGALWATVLPRAAGPAGKGEVAYDAIVCDEQGEVHVTLEGYRTVALPDEVDRERRAPLRAAVE